MTRKLDDRPQLLCEVRISVIAFLLRVCPFNTEYTSIGNVINSATLFFSFSWWQTSNWLTKLNFPSVSLSTVISIRCSYFIRSWLGQVENYEFGGEGSVSASDLDLRPDNVQHFLFRWNEFWSELFGRVDKTQILGNHLFVQTGIIPLIKMSAIFF